VATVCLFAAFLILGGVAGASAERLFGGDTLVSGEPTGIGNHSTRCSGQHCIETPGDSVFVAWYGDGPGGHGVYLSRSISGGAQFETPRRVNDPGIAAYNPSLAIDSAGHIYIVWVDKRDGDGPYWNIYLAKSTDGGVTFGSDIRVDDAGDDPSGQTWPAVAADDSGRVYVVWLDERGNGGLGVYATRSTDGGASFDSSVALPNPLGYIPYPQEGPSIAARGDGEVYVACLDYTEDGPGSWFAAMRRSTDAGQTYGDPVYVAEYLNISVQATSIALGGSTDVYIAWPDQYPCMARSIDCGQTFGPVVQVSDLPACCAPPERRISISVGVSGWIGVAWRHYYDTVAFSESRDGGGSFLPPVLFDGAGNRGGASTAFDDSLSVYFIWTDYRHSIKGDIYFSKGILDPGAGTAEEPNGMVANDASIRVWPNPFSTSTMIRSEASFGPACVYVYDPVGREVRRLVCPDAAVSWDGRDSRGRLVAPGLYLIRIDQPRFGTPVKVIVSR
jgi:hypothetical protein